MSEKTIQVTLPSTLAEFVQGQIDSGRFRTESDVIVESLRRLEDQKQQEEADWDEVKRKIDHGLQQALQGDLHDGEEFFEELKRRFG